MTRERAKELLPVITAYAEGKIIEHRTASGHWGVLPYELDFDGNDYRIKPEPKLRPWRPEEVPVGAVVQLKYNLSVRRMITSSDPVELHLGGHQSGYGRVELLEKWQLLDGKPCGVEEATP